MPNTCGNVLFADSLAYPSQGGYCMKTKTLRITEILDAEKLDSILDCQAPVEQVVTDLFLASSELAHSVTPRAYDNWQEFVGAHTSGQSALVELEGSSSIDTNHVVVLRHCPMAGVMKALAADGELPAFYAKIVEGYRMQNPGSNAILHPGCIAHQVARQMIIKEIEVGGESDLNFYQLACRSEATGRVVYDDNGLAAVGMSKETAQALVSGSACLYAIARKV
jgi:hypothetical protein